MKILENKIKLTEEEAKELVTNYKYYVTQIHVNFSNKYKYQLGEGLDSIEETIVRVNNKLYRIRWMERGNKKHEYYSGTFPEVEIKEKKIIKIEYVNKN
jgi:hypothetical protein